MRTNGITLVALVVTIVVLLILAGITITYVMGDNSIFNQASKSKLHTELAKIEEQASIIYSNKLLQKAKENLNEKPTMQELVNELRENDYEIKQIAANGNTVTGISLDKENMTLGYEKSNTIQITLKGNNNEELYDYYVKVNNKYYQMHFNDGAVTIDRTESDISNSEDTEKPVLAVKSENETIATITMDKDTNIVTVTATNKAGKTAIVVTYGEYEARCNVTVIVATDLEINSIRARISTGYTRWLTATVKPETASQEFKWTSSNTEVATIDNNGVITANKKGKTTITVKTTDGSNLSKDCSVTVDDGIDIMTLTEIQNGDKVARDMNGNLVIIPDGFRVLMNATEEEDISVIKYNYDQANHTPCVQDGIVIADKDKNQFVWIPVDSISVGTEKPADDIRLGRYESWRNNPTPVASASTTIEGYYQELTTGKGNTVAKNLSAFINNTNTDGGYWLARYIASGNAESGAKFKSKEFPWDKIDQPDAAKYARSMKSSGTYQSDLQNSYTWDTTIIFIQKYSQYKEFYACGSLNPANNYTGRYYYPGTCNICDIASNGIEWTTETCTAEGYPYTLRGPTCVNQHALCASSRYNGGFTWLQYPYDRTFRCILYRN